MLFQAACARVSLAPGGMSRGAGMHAAGSRVRLGEVTRGRCAVPLPGSAGRRLRRQGLGREADPGVWDSSREHPWSVPSRPAECAWAAPSLFPVLVSELGSKVSSLIFLGGLGKTPSAKRDTPSPERSRG